MYKIVILSPRVSLPLPAMVTPSFRYGFFRFLVTIAVNRDSLREDRRLLLLVMQSTERNEFPLGVLSCR